MVTNATASEVSNAALVLNKLHSSSIASSGRLSSGSGEISLTDFDLSKAVIGQVNGQADKVYVFNAVNNTGIKQRALAIYNYGQSNAKVLVIETESDKSITLTNYDSSYKITVTLENGVPQSKLTRFNQSNSSSSRLIDCGNAVAACLENAYTGQGWISVWATVQSAFIPVTVAVIAAACVAHNC